MVSDYTASSGREQLYIPFSYTVTNHAQPPCMDVVGGNSLYRLPWQFLGHFPYFWLTLTHPHYSFPIFPIFPTSHAGTHFPRNCQKCSHGQCTCTPDSGLGMSRMSNTGNFQYLKNQIPQEPVMQTLEIYISTESYRRGESIYGVGIEVFGDFRML